MIIIGFGANLDSKHGNPTETYEHVLLQLSENNIQIVNTSSLWSTSPVGTQEDQPWYTNAVISVETDKSPQDLLACLLAIEKQIGRERLYRNAPRVVDLDLLDYNGELINSDDLILPHPRMHERLFVLEPLKEINPDWSHPVTGRSLEDLRGDIPDDQKIEKIMV